MKSQTDASHRIAQYHAQNGYGIPWVIPGLGIELRCQSEDRYEGCSNEHATGAKAISPEARQASVLPRGNFSAREYDLGESSQAGPKRRDNCEQSLENQSDQDELNDHAQWTRSESLTMLRIDEVSIPGLALYLSGLDGFVLE